MTMSFADQVRTAVTDAEGAVNTEPARRFRAVLDELVDGLQMLDVGARIQPGKDARKLVLYLYPAHRPLRGHLMLTFILHGTSIVVSGETSVTLDSPDELQSWLLRYVQLPAFLGTLGALREEAKLPVEARLQVDRQGPHAADDMVVAVSPEGQKRLDETSKGSDVELEVERLDFPGNGSYAPETKYLLLESEGLSVSVDRVEPAAGKLRVVGKRA